MKIVRRKYIRTVVERLLTSHAGLATPPIQVEDLAVALGIDVRSTQPSDGALSGFLVRDDGTGKTIIGINEDHPPTRKRFSIAHEIGHFLLHEGQEIYVDECVKSGMRISLRNEESSKGTEIEEIEANVFAAELLMPVDCLRSDLAAYPDSDEEQLEAMLQTLADKYAVSKQALSYRLVNLGYLRL